MIIPTLFQRSPDGLLAPEVTPGCEWVVGGHGIATEKLNGRNILVEVDGETVVDVQIFFAIDYVPMREGWDDDIAEAVNAIRLGGWSDGIHECEVVGPKILGNPYQMDYHRAFPLDWHFLPYLPVRIEYNNVLATFDLLSKQMPALRSAVMPGANIPAEGIVWYHLDGRVAQLTGWDFHHTVNI